MFHNAHVVMPRLFEQKASSSALICKMFSGLTLVRPSLVCFAVHVLGMRKSKAAWLAPYLCNFCNMLYYAPSFETCPRLCSRGVPRNLNADDASSGDPTDVSLPLPCCTKKYPRKCIIVFGLVICCGLPLFSLAVTLIGHAVGCSQDSDGC